MSLHKYISPLLGQYHKCESVVYFFLKELNISVPLGLLKKQLDIHPDYPSMLAISDILSNYGVKNTSSKQTLKHLGGLMNH